MTFKEFHKLVLANKDKCGVSCWCANCGCNLMHAPISYMIKKPGEIRASYDFCFKQCPGCMTMHPPLKQAQVFTEWEFNHYPTASQSYYKKRKTEVKPKKNWYDKI